MSPVTTTCGPSRPNGSGQTEFPWMSSAEGFPVRTSRLQERGRDSPANDRDYGASTPELLARFDPDTSSWRTWQLCLVEGLETFSETWPRSGLMRSGIAYQLPPLAPLTDEIGFGLWPTPTLTYTRADWTQEEITARQEEVKAATLAKGKHHTGNGFGLNLAQAVRFWPTPRANDAEKRGNIANDKRNGLPAAVKYWPTPTARDYRTGDNPESRRARMKASGEWHSPNLNDVAAPGGQLNPRWVEWLMGFPLGWTALEPSETPSSLRSPRSSAARSSKRKGG